MHHWLELALLVSRILIIISELDDRELCKADLLQLHPPASQHKCPVVMSCTGRHTGKGPAKQQLINLM